MKTIIADVLAIFCLIFVDSLFQRLFGWSLFSLTPHFDKVLHFAAGILLADIYYRLPLKKNFLRVVGFAFAIAILWECAEPFLGFAGIGERYAVFTEPWMIDTIGDIVSVVVGGMMYYFLSKLCNTYSPAK